MNEDRSIPCPKCGGRLFLIPESDQLKCADCGEVFPIDVDGDEPCHTAQDIDLNINIDAEQIGYDFERGRQRASVEFTQGFADALENNRTKLEASEASIQPDAPAPQHSMRTVSPLALLGVTVAVVLLILLIASPFRGNSNSTPAPQPVIDNPEGSASTAHARELEIVDSAYVLDNGFVEFVVEIHNPNDGLLARSASIIVTGKNPDGTVAFSEESIAGNIFPNSSTYWAFFAGDGSVAEGVSVEFSISSSTVFWEECSVDAADLYSFNNASVALAPSGGLLHATGEITLNHESDGNSLSDMSNPVIVCVLRDSNGALVGGFTGIVPDKLVVGEPVAFEITSTFAVPEYATAELYAYPW